MKLWLVPDNPPTRPECFVVPSYALRNADRPTRPTRSSLELAAEWWRRFPDALIIVSTGDNQRLGVTNVSFVANVPDWMPEVMYNLLQLANRHKGLSIIRIVQRCPHYLPHLFDPLVTDPDTSLMLLHDSGLSISDELGKIYKNQLD